MAGESASSSRRRCGDKIGPSVSLVSSVVLALSVRHLPTPGCAAAKPHRCFRPLDSLLTADRRRSRFVFFCCRRRRRSSFQRLLRSEGVIFISSTVAAAGEEPGDHLAGGSRDARAGAGGCRRPGLRADTHTPRVSLSLWTPIRRQQRFSGSPASLLLGTAMSARKTSFTDKRTKNGTSKYVLERCASVNEYYDIVFKVCIPVLSGFCCFVVEDEDCSPSASF